MTNNNPKLRAGRLEARTVDDSSQSYDQPTNADTIHPFNLDSHISVNTKEEPARSASKTNRSLASRISLFPEKKESPLSSGTIKPTCVAKNQR
ncbi:hypothetical protein PCANC_28275 [Puccinia coronata f. sp. avenae]|uniref:Uncharacterized protein n=1 Tax=Puccinia coronata f. sp. avenae TaxID=200324 RepID=A0A2N5RWV3_9BASI|nr:hypothetical protein PCANC_28275 [Puccinia coronata f. sp. avenae]